MAYVISEYPRVSHTFIQREIETLRAMGLRVEACTVRKPAASGMVGAAQEAEDARTFGVIQAARNPLRLIRAHLAMMRRGRWLSALSLAWKTRPPGLKALIWQAFYFLEAGILADHARARGVTHLHNHFGDASGTLTMVAAHMAGLPFSITLHGPDIFFAPRHWRLDVKIARAAFVACISHFCRSQAMLFSDEADWGRLRIVHCGIRPALYPASRGGGGHVVFVGRLDPVKGVPLLLEAFAAVKARHPEARLTVAGDGRIRSRLEARARALGLEVAFPGYLDEGQVAELLAEADMLVLPSFAEGLPVVLMEALAARVPVIATQVAGVSELVRDGVSGLIVAPGDVAGLAVAMDRLLSDPDLRARMGAAGRAKVEAEHDIQAEAAWLAELFAGRGQGLRPEPRLPETHGPEPRLPQTQPGGQRPGEPS
nr:glycosyltransferase family 4 protein [Stagnihabitans tardus]